MSVLENVRIALQRPRGDSFSFWRPEKALSVLDDQAMSLLRDVGLEGDARRLAVELPYGRKRALELATTLALAEQLDGGQGHYGLRPDATAAAPSLPPTPER